MIVVYFSIVAISLVIYFGVVRPRLEKSTGKKLKGWESLDEEMPYVAVFGILPSVFTFFATVACYYFDLGIEVSAEDIRHSLYVIFSFGMALAFFGFTVPRALHFRYNDFTFSKPPSNFGALFLIISTFIALRPLMKYVAEVITQTLVMIWSLFI